MSIARSHFDTIIFTMGLPAAGKSTYVADNFDRETHLIIDPDAIKEGHEDYDPSDPAALHAWSQRIAEILWKDVLVRSSILPLATKIRDGQTDALRVIVDGTGTNAEKMVRRIREAKDAGFKVELIYVKCSLDTSLRRNAARERVVPEYIIREKALDIETSFDLISPHVKKITIIVTD